ncbi:MAG: right-handed parallel beta-helix repeat-containing protein [Verrucomicrobia bacterium]|nr:right-handed parallel beta-helix repeat-containing protein [Verrucomicrobiota bacterium]
MSIVGIFQPNAPDLDPSIDVAAVTGAGGQDAFAVQLDSAGYLPGSTLPSFEVTTTADTGAGSLRRALEFANHTPTPDTITFNIPGAGPHTISPLSPLPALPYPVSLDGLTQPGASAGSWPPDLRIVIDGTSAGSGANGFDLDSKYLDHPRFIRGLVIQNFDGYALDVGLGYRALTVSDCFIGTSLDGTTAQPNGAGGIYDESGNVTYFSPELLNAYGVAGGGTFGRNLISGNGGPGLFVEDGGFTTIQNNYIGTTVTGASALPNAGAGILLDGNTTVGGAPAARYFTIGGLIASEANLIAYNGGGGVRLGLVRSARISGNSIHSNGGLGIEFSSSTPLGNDVADQDDGSPNNAMNHPIIERAILSGGQTLVDGWLDGIPGGRFRLEFFTSSSADPSGSGEGETFLGASWVETSRGPAVFSVTLPAVGTGQVISATATADERSTNGEGTSQFSPAVTVVAPNVTTFADSGPGSFRQALMDANNHAGPDILVLDPGLAGQVLKPTTDLPPITGETTIQAPEGFVLSGNNTRRPLTINAPGQEVTLINLILEDGSADDGAGILHIDGTLNLRRCIIRDCTATGDGGGLAVQAGVVNVEDCRFTGNHADGSGGGIVRLGGDLNVDRALLDGNTAGVSGGGGYCAEGVFGQPSQSSDYRNTTFCNNSAPLGGGFRRDSSQGSADLSFCTIVENTASTSGGGISAALGDLTAVNCIVSLNTAPAVTNAENISAIDNFIGGDPQLGPLRDNGGFVPTFALLTGSPAINAFPSSSATGTDARQAPRSSGDRADRGAFEFYEGPSAEDAPSYSSWANKLPIGVRGETDDPNGDGISNLESMYFGLYALGSNDVQRFGLRRSDSGDVVLSYSVPIWMSGTDVSSSIWVADELPSTGNPNPWSAAPPSVELGSTTANIDYELALPVDAIPRKIATFRFSTDVP